MVQGGNTGLVGGGVPGRAATVSGEPARLTGIGHHADRLAQVTVGAGVTLERLAGHARSAGLDFGVDLAARDSATVGGLIATNAGGDRVLRYGSMRTQVAGIEAVIAGGPCSAAWPAWPRTTPGTTSSALLVGSEGTLAVITRARLRLVPAAATAEPSPAWRSPGPMSRGGAGGARDRLATLTAAEIFTPTGSRWSARTAGLPAPFAERHPAYLVIECAGRDRDPTDDAARAMLAGLCRGRGRDGRDRPGRAGTAVGLPGGGTPRRSAPPACR